MKKSKQSVSTVHEGHTVSGSPEAIAEMIAALQRHKAQEQRVRDPASLEAINHLTGLAERGGPAGSGGEQRARRLCRLLHQAIEECVGLDIAAVEGAGHILHFANHGGEAYWAVRERLEPFSK